ncbi:sigma-54-dependent Fis family transcriptional regulator [Campylobacter volucris]|uniref:Sigma-54-dependent Fis family transcriptional regulator n=1 Tax=Campylobacter volucris TaxID=1031542 RepID=A0AAE5YH45_9BACT|nr:sigma-54 dependent transcriptional regulator [Campylobacter volucris]AJC93791.1 sigma54-dependent response regulator [Campylobacter volucris LMG 24379]KAB0579081.1 sigma-54-dependent Fis family transcriptional regulator [Campylobacter volucris]QBL13830.1 sigma-54-dependent Fis family transcriptional regulator [Campylobacter volucris]QEL08004.1 flagella-associated two-component system, response regulator [Campylobacter volucris]TDJ87315.1 sigma-54-dependent Fis family transcriptional regulat
MNLVIVEDDINMRKSLEIALSEYEEFKIKSYKSATEALKKLNDDVDLIITDINMPGIDGIEFVQACENKYDFIIITGNATLNRAIEAVRLGVKDFLVKPFDINTLVTAIKRAKIIQEKTSKKSTKKTEKQEVKEDFFGKSQALEHCLNLASKAAKTDASVLLFGESGVGKEVFANYIHKNSKRASKPFIAINMAAIPANLIESELFGFEKGAFTDANATKIGLFELANEGTLFLDEIGEMPYEIQAKLLRALQEKEITRLGGTKSVKIDVRIVSATNANIEKKIENNEFRQDLYYRLNTIPVNIPPLRQRQDEILQIAQKVLLDTCKEYEFTEKKLSKQAQNALLSYDFPGNIRELISIIQRACILSESDEISEQDLFLESRKSKDIKNLEKELILEALKNSSDIAQAAKLIGMSEQIFCEKMKKYNIN